MSDDSTMGLFGSKDEKTESTSTDANKQNSSDRYAPYCIDSDSETYDTEALSIMDINDIIGVQTGGAAESTLESEIAALSEMITDSKSETSSDTMNDNPKENKDNKFTEKLVTEINSSTVFVSPLSTTNEESLKQEFIKSEAKSENMAENEKNAAVSEKIKDSLFTNLLEMKNEILNDSKNVVADSSQQNSKETEPESESRAKERSVLSPDAGNLDCGSQTKQIKSLTENTLLTNIENFSEDEKSRTETISDPVSQVETDSLVVTVDVLEIGTENETVKDNSSKCQDDKVIQDAVMDMDITNVEAVDSSVTKNQIVKDKMVDDSMDEKSTDVLTNLGSTSKSLQLIGEAYISEDSQEIDETDESPISEVAALSLHSIQEHKTAKEDSEDQEKNNSNDAITDILINELNEGITTDNSDNAVTKHYTDNEIGGVMDDISGPDNKTEVSSNAGHNLEDCIGQDKNIESQKGGLIIDEDKSIDLKLHEDGETTDKSIKLVEITSATTEDIDPDPSIEQKTTSAQDFLESKEESPKESEQLEDISSNSGVETVRVTLKDEVFDLKINQSTEKLGEEICDHKKLSDETVDSNLAMEMEDENISAMDLVEIPSKELEVSSSIVEVGAKTKLDDTTELNPKIQAADIKAKASEPIIKQDSSSALTESNSKTEVIASESSQPSFSDLQPSIIEDEVPNEEAKSSTILAENSKCLKNVDKQSTAIIVSEKSLITTKEQSVALSDIVDNISEIFTKTEKSHILDEIVGPEEIQVHVKDIKNEVKKIEDEGSSMTNKEKKDENMASEPGESYIIEPSKLEAMENTSMSVEKSVDDLEMYEEELPLEKSQTEREEGKKLDTEFNQSIKVTSNIEEDAPTDQIVETELSEGGTSTIDIEKLSTSVIKADSLPSEMDEKKLGKEKDNSTDMDTDETIQTASYIGSITGAVVSKVISTITQEDEVANSSTADISSSNVEPLIQKIVESRSSEDDMSKHVSIEESLKGTENSNCETRVESGVPEIQRENVADIETCDDTARVQDIESVSQFSGDENEKQFEKFDGKENIKVTEPIAEIVREQAAILEEEIPTVRTKQDSLEDESSFTLQIRHESDENSLEFQLDEHEDRIVACEDQLKLVDEVESARQNNETNDQELSHSDTECTLGSVNPTTTSELSPETPQAEKPDEPECQAAKLADDTNSQPILDDHLNDATINIPEVPAEISCASKLPEMEMTELEDMESSLASEEIPESLGVEDKFEEDKILLAMPVDSAILNDVNCQTLEKNSESIVTQSDENEVEGDLPITLESVNLVESEVKMDEDLQTQPTEELEHRKAEENEMMIGEIADAASEGTTNPLETVEELEILPNSELTEIKDDSTSFTEEIDQKIFIEDSNETLPTVSYSDDYITDVLISSTNIDGTQPLDNEKDMIVESVTADKFEEKSQECVVESGENLIINETLSMDENITEIDDKLLMDKNIEIALPFKQDEETLIECAVLRACGNKIDLPNEELFDADDPAQVDILCDAPADNADTSQQSSEFSELECAVKFLQESEEQTIDSPLLLSPKIAEGIIEDNSNQSKTCLFLSETEVCQDISLALPVELAEITPDSMAISEAEIISEAAKLENERKLKIAEEMYKSSERMEKSDSTEEITSESNSQMLKSLLTTPKVSSWQDKTEEHAASTSENSQIPKLTDRIIRRSEKIPKISILEERLKEPPKIEIPVPEMSPKISDTPTTPKASLLIQRDSGIDTKLMYQKMLESPKAGDKSESRIVETPRKDSEKHDFENVGSPRIILKIAKSAIADCGEPRSPKSPKIRSAANSPNPEDSPGQKLGKIKLKLSRGGHPSIISNETYEETAPRHTEAILSPSHIGMKIKLSKTGDASIIQPEKHDSLDEIKESKHKYDDHSPKRIDSPLGMKIKLSKTGDPSIVQQEIPKRTDSPIGMKIKLSKSGDASIIQPEKQESLDDAGYVDKFEIGKDIPKRTESPLGMKIKLSKTGDASIISSEGCEEFKESSSKSRDKLNANQDIPKRTDSPLGMKFKLTKSGGASIIQPDKPDTLEDYKDKLENTVEITKRVESPIGMKIKLSKTGDASIIHPERQESDEYREAVLMKHREKSEAQEVHKRTDSPLGMRIKVMKTGEASVVQSEDFKDSLLSPNTENFDITHEVRKRNESPNRMKIKLSKSGDASIILPDRQESGESSISQEGSKSAESSLGVKIKLSKTGDASIIHPETSPESKRTDSPLGMKIKLSKTGDASIIEPEKKDKSNIKQKEKSSNTQEVSQKRKDTEFPLEMKIKLSKTGHPTIIANEKQESLSELHSKIKDPSDSDHKHAESTSAKDSQLRIFKTGHSTIIQSNRSEVTIEPIQLIPPKSESSLDISPKSKDMLISPVDSKRSKLESKLSHILPEVSIQPVMPGEQQQQQQQQHPQPQQQITLDKKSSSISRQQMSVINQEISITQIPLSKPADLSMSGKLKEILRKNATNSPASSDCEIIEHRPELIIVNENSNSSQDIMIIEEVKAMPMEVKVPRKRGRPKRSTLPPGQLLLRQPFPQGPSSMDNMQPFTAGEPKESDRPKRTCRSQKSYAPPKRGRGRGRGKRKMDRADCAVGKIPRLEDPLTAIEKSTMSLIAPLQPRMIPEPNSTVQTSELYKALKQSPTERKRMISDMPYAFPDGNKKLRLDSESDKQLATHLAVELKSDQHTIVKTALDTSDPNAVMISEMLQFSEPVSAQQNNEKLTDNRKPEIQENKNIITDMTTTEHQNWLTPSIKLPETTGKTEALSMVQVMDEETRMSAESNSRSQTPARNISIPAVETVINEESQGSVLSTATTESEKVKVRNRRMEINFDPDEGPFTVDKIAEYEWPLDKKGDTFMIQEQISQYLGVKSFKRKYPDLKRRMVEMEERNFLRENCLVSEGMCDMGLTAICSSEVLDIMCSDFPDQYEEYRKHMREKQAKEHSKKQKELTAAANAERNRIDLAEMAVQSALSWNVNFNKARKESRKYSLDLQSFTIHVPKKQQKVDAERKASNYPVALIPGQYTDYYREYTPAELRYYPLNTVLYGPMRPNERKFDSQSEGSQSDSDSDSSSDDSSSTSSEGTQDTEESQSTVDDVDMELATHKEDNKNLKCKMCLRHLNKHGKTEVLIQCGTCNGNVHPSCIDLTLDMVPHIQGYSWQCTDCKTCVQCHNPADEDKMLFCDMCDRGYHIYCVGLRRVPQGRWHCRECAVCASCGLRQPGGANSDRNSVAQWQHEYKKGERNTRVYVSTLCVPCSKLWRKGRYCPHCSRCHSAQRLDLEPNLVHCGVCDKYLHLGCVEIRSGTLDRKHYICECCSTPNHQLSRSLISKTYRT